MSRQDSEATSLMATRYIQHFCPGLGWTPSEDWFVSDPVQFMYLDGISTASPCDFWRSGDLWQMASTAPLRE